MSLDDRRLVWRRRTISDISAAFRSRSAEIRQPGDDPKQKKRSVYATMADLLEVLSEHEGRTASEIAEQMFPHEKGVEGRVRSYVTWLRDALQLLGETPTGRRLPLEVTVENRTHKLTFTAREFDVKRFWAPHRVEAPSVIVCTAPVFLRNLSLRLLIRQLDLNRDKDWKTHTRAWLRTLELPAVKPAEATLFRRIMADLVASDEFVLRRPYTTVGEMKCAFRLTACMDRIGVAIEHALAHEGTRDTNLIMLGNARTNYTLQKLQLKHRLLFRLREKSVQVMNPPTGRKVEEYYDDLKPDGHVYGTISRFVDHNRVVTMIGSNHSWAFDELGEVLTDQVKLLRLIHDQKVGMPDWDDLPERFEILIKLFLSTETEKVDHWRIVSSYGFPGSTANT